MQGMLGDAAPRAGTDTGALQGVRTNHKADITRAYVLRELVSMAKSVLGSVILADAPLMEVIITGQRPDMHACTHMLRWMSLPFPLVEGIA